MADDGKGHSKGVKKDEFCALRKDDCGHNKYQENCRPSEDWPKYPQEFTGSIKDKAKKVIGKFKDSRRRSYEAHHAVCVASVTGIIAEDTEIESVVRNTQWCVNYKPNMIALPMWAQSIQWYCYLSRAHLLKAEILSDDIGGGYKATPAPAPPFRNLPQHDYDHGRYITEVDTELKEIVKEVKKLAGKHEEQKKKLKDELDNLVGRFKTELQTRGLRTGGTHAAWNLGMNFPDSDWYMPFSMAKDSEVEARPFPANGLLDGSVMAEKIMSVAQSYWLEGAHILL